MLIVVAHPRTVLENRIYQMTARASRHNFVFIAIAILLHIKSHIACESINVPCPQWTFDLSEQSKVLS